MYNETVRAKRKNEEKKMFNRTKMLKNGSLTVKIAFAPDGYAVYMSHNGENTVEGVYPRRQIAINVATGILAHAS